MVSSRFFRTERYNKNMKFPSIRRNLVPVTAILLIILIGSVIVIQTYRQAKRELITAHDSHLTDIAHSVDQNLNNLLTIFRQELEQTVKTEEFQAAEAEWLERGNDSAIREAITDNAFRRSDGISGMLAILETHTKITCLGDEHQYMFPYKNYYENIWLCRDDQDNSYLAIIQPSAAHPVRYAALIELNTLYGYLVGEELRGDYSIQLYDSTSRLLMYNERLDFQTLRVGWNDAEERSDGIGILARAERYEESVVGNYTLPVEGRSSESFRISALPTTQNRNQIFGISVAVSYEVVYGALTQMLVRLILCFFIITASLVILIIVIARSERRERKTRAQLDRLQTQNDAMAELIEKTEKLAHHQRLELIGTMSSSLSHEVNNMLTPIMGYSIMAMEKLPEYRENPSDDLNDEITDYLSEIYQSSSRAKQLITRISSLSRGQSDRVFAEISPDELLEKVMLLAGPSIPPNIAVVRDLSAGEKCIRANELQLQQAFLNIILNALDAMKSDGGTLTITTKMREDTVIVRIIDTGCGIPPEILSRIFEPFFTTKETGKGTGLGLAIAAQAAEDHSAKLEVDSKPGAGTEFRFLFPRLTDTQMDIGSAQNADSSGKDESEWQKGT